MKVATGTVVDGKVVVEGETLAEGETVTLADLPREVLDGNPSALKSVVLKSIPAPQPRSTARLDVPESVAASAIFTV